MTEHPELRATVFGEVLASLLEARGLEVSPFAVGKLGEQSGLDGWKLINRMANADAEDTGHLGGLANAMDLSEPEKVQLACAYTFERRAGEVRA
jgi:arginyl-tRNA synthetase